ncbi:hypothetical protein K3495_g14244 [Podosphaera aphanis]|nr:hypothetical protein K3495_g14244 [Podosphaera aphanis]
MVQNKTLVYKRIPNGYPVPGQDLLVEDKGFNLNRSSPLGGLTVQTIYASLDPYQRACMGGSGLKPLLRPLTLGKPLMSLSIAKVLKSNSIRFSKGDLIIGLLPIQEYSYVKEENTSLYAPIMNPYNLDLPLFLGILGMPGLAAFGSMIESKRAFGSMIESRRAFRSMIESKRAIGSMFESKKEDETMFISSAAGDVGHFVGQLAKKEGLKVIGSVGSDEKLNYIINELEFDGGFNYKKENPLDALRRLAPGGIDIYHDNVGGEQLDAALESMNQFGLILCCGMISDYSKLPHERYRVKNLMNVATKELIVQGFSVIDFFENFGFGYPEMAEAYACRLKHGFFHTRSHVIDGIDNGPEGFVAMLKGEFIGKPVIQIADE